MSKIDPWAWRRLDERRAGYEFDAEFTDAPYLTALVQIATVIGTFIGMFAAIGVAYQWHNGIGDYWSLVLILVVDVAVNVVARVARRRRRRGPLSTRDSHAPADRGR